MTEKVGAMDKGRKCFFISLEISCIEGREGVEKCFNMSSIIACYPITEYNSDWNVKKNISLCESHKNLEMPPSNEGASASSLGVPLTKLPVLRMSLKEGPSMYAHHRGN